MSISWTSNLEIRLIGKRKGHLNPNDLKFQNTIWVNSWKYQYIPKSPLSNSKVVIWYLCTWFIVRLISFNGSSAWIRPWWKLQLSAKGFSLLGVQNSVSACQELSYSWNFCISVSVSYKWKQLSAWNWKILEISRHLCCFVFFPTNIDTGQV